MKMVSGRLHDWRRIRYARGESIADSEHAVRRAARPDAADVDRDGRDGAGHAGRAAVQVAP